MTKHDKPKTYRALVRVVLKPGVLDPQGAAVERALLSLGNQNVKSVRIGKLIDIVLDAESEEKARELASVWADEFLTNINMETYEIELGELP
jgi:phosphoribosylformylglycinamidine synthase